MNKTVYSNLTKKELKQVKDGLMLLFDENMVEFERRVCLDQPSIRIYKRIHKIVQVANKFGCNISDDWQDV